MTKFKTQKIDFWGKDAYSYRDFIIMNEYQFLNTPASWVVKFPNGKQVHENGNGTKREMMKWVDGYYTEMNDFVNSEELININ